MAQIKDLIVTGVSRVVGKSYASEFVGPLSGNAATATKATQDSAGQQINTTYIKGLSVSGRTITYTRGDGTTGTLTTQDTNTTYGTGNASTLGLTKLYTSTGSATDGTMTQKAITDALGGKAASSHTHTKSQITDFPTSLPASDVYSWAKASTKPSYAWSEITGKPSTFTPSSHTHNYAGSSSAGGAANSVANAIAIKLNGGTTEGTNMFTFNGSAAKTINITPSAIGAAASSHGTHVSYSTDAPKANGTASAGSSGAVARADHVHPLQTSVSGNAGTATKLATARNIAVSGEITGNANFDGSGNINISTTRQKFNGGGTPGTIGYVAFAQLKIASSYVNRPSEFTLCCRGRGTPCVVSISFANDIQSDPPISELKYYGTDYGVFAYKSGTSTWLLYYTKSEEYDDVSVTDVNITGQYINVTYPGTFITSKPSSNVTNASLGYNVGYAATATKATQDSAGQQINTTYIKGLSVSGRTITYTRGDGTTGTITTQDTDTNTWRGIQNNLTSDSTTDSLSAAQGKVLKGLVDGKAASSHTHNYAGSSSAGGAANSVANALTISLNGTSQGAYNGSSAKSINITPSAIGAAASSHGTHVSYSTDAPKANGTASAGSSGAVARADHVHPLQTSVSGNAGTATKLATARKIGNANFDGSANITLAQIGIINPIELTKAEYNALKANGTLDMSAYYNITDDYDSATVIDDTTVSSKFVFSSSKTESMYAKKSTVVDTTLSASSWSGSSAPYTYTLSVSGVTATNVNEINFSSSATDAQVEAYQNAMLKDGGQSSGKITLKATGDKPTVDIPITIIVRHDV